MSLGSGFRVYSLSFQQFHGEVSSLSPDSSQDGESLSLKLVRGREWCLALNF